MTRQATRDGSSFGRLAGATLALWLATASAVLPPEAYHKRIRESEVKGLAVVRKVDELSESRGVVNNRVTFAAVDLATLQPAGQTFTGTLYSRRPGAEIPVGGTIYHAPQVGETVFVTVATPGGEVTSYTPLTARLLEALRKNTDTVVPGMGIVEVEDGSDKLLEQADELARGRKFEDALAVLKQAIALNASYDRVYQMRALVHDALKRHPEALADRQKCLDLDPQSWVHCNSVAWMLLTCPEAKCRDFKKGLELAQKAVALAKRGETLDTLACAYAANGDLPKAIEVEKEALAIEKDPDLTAELTRRLKGFEEGKTYLEQTPPPPPAKE
jgi:hypothetical protein